MSKKGFTLIELLVVIAIIGLLATIVMVSVNSARIKARNSKRQAEIKQFNLVMEMYYDTNGSYPSSCGAWACMGHWKSGQTCAAGVQCQALDQALLTYMSVIPDDPLNKAGCAYGDAYYYWTNGSVTYFDTRFESMSSCPSGYFFWGGTGDCGLECGMRIQ